MNTNELKLRMINLLAKTIRFHDDGFAATDVKTILAPMPDYDLYLKKKKEAQSGIEEIPAELRLMYQEPLLTREQEYHLFRKMNYFKWCADKLIKKGDYKSVPKIESFLESAKSVSDHIALANMRLIVSRIKIISREFRSNPSILAELISDGNIGLCRAIDYFDYRRRLKFSTYATLAINDSLGYFYHKRCRDTSRGVMTGMDEVLDKHIDESTLEPQNYSDLTLKLEKVLRQIPAREQEVIRRYYGIGTAPKILNDLGIEFGVTKERVRQLRERALRKLRLKMEAPCV